MFSRATTTIAIYRGQVNDDWGDPEDQELPVAINVRASIIEQKTYSKGESTTQPRNFRFARLRVTKGTDIRTNDRILDERTRQVWIITNISPIQNPVVGQDLRVDLQYVG